MKLASARYPAALCLVLLLVGGCGSMAGSATDRWAASHGGIFVDNRQTRAEAALRRLALPVSSISARVEVLNSDSLCAYAWPDGRLFVTRALVDLLPEPELSAALAHELGHLRAEPSPSVSPSALTSPASSRKATSPTAVEAAADRAGVELLRRSQLPPDLLLRVLERLMNDPRTTSECKAMLVERLSLLSARSHP